MYYEYSANKTGDYLRDVVAPEAVRREQLLNELARTRCAAEPGDSQPRAWVRAFAAARLWIRGAASRNRRTVGVDENWTGEVTTP